MYVTVVPCLSKCSTEIYVEAHLWLVYCWLLKATVMRKTQATPSTEDTIENELKYIHVLCVNSPSHHVSVDTQLKFSWKILYGSRSTTYRSYTGDRDTHDPFSVQLHFG